MDPASIQRSIAFNFETRIHLCERSGRTARADSLDRARRTSALSIGQLEKAHGQPRVQTDDPDVLERGHRAARTLLASSARSPAKELEIIQSEP
jgi:hypothetical protein